jgi:hypothetical protein
MVSSIDALRQARPDITIALYIVSSCYGLLAESDLVVPYTADLGTSTRKWHATGDRLNLYERLGHRLHEARYVVYCLSAAYLTAARAPFNGPGTAIYLAVPGFLHDFTTVIAAGRREACALGISERMVRAAVLQQLCTGIARNGLASLAPRTMDLPAATDTCR